MRKSPVLSAILVGGLIAGTFDITYATVFSAFYGVTATRVLQSVASGVMGPAAMSGGAFAATLGFILHFLIALTWATLFSLICRLVPALVRHPIPAGLVYGSIIYVLMYLVVAPLSACVIKFTFTPATVTRNLLVHMFLIGLPIALAARTFLPSADRTRPRASG
ncbi:MAG TPA: hypothetical protein VGM73_10710 [Candidatus Didemnitutus sp.]|jgi:hypothetical protein